MSLQNYAPGVSDRRNKETLNIVVKREIVCYRNMLNGTNPRIPSGFVGVLSMLGDISECGLGRSHRAHLSLQASSILR